MRFDATRAPIVYAGALTAVVGWSAPTAATFFGKTEDRDALLALRDGARRVRLRLRVTGAGAASLDFLDATGKVTRTVAAAPSG